MSFRITDTKRKLLEFRVTLEPQAHDRPRFGNGRTFETKKNIHFRRDFRQAAEPHRPPTALGCAIALELVFWMHPPKRLVVGRNYPGRPDIDNLQKAVMDSMNPTYRKDKLTGERVCTYAGFWQDDAQVVALHGSKFWASEGTPPGVLVVLYEA